MTASYNDILTTKIYFLAAFPALKVALQEDKKCKKDFEKINAIVEFNANDDVEPLSCYMIFLDEETSPKSIQDKRFKVYQGKYPGFVELKDGSKLENLEVVRMNFKSIKSLLGVFKGNSPLEMLGIVPCLIKNLFKKTTFKFLNLMLMLTKTMPNYVPTIDKKYEQYIKVKLSLVLITKALSKANKLGWKEMSEWTIKQPDRTYQFIVGPTLDEEGKELYPRITANLRVKKGLSKATTGINDYPFVLFKFPNPDACIAVLTGRYGFVDCVGKGCVEIIGAGDSYAVEFNGIMTKCQNMLVPSKLAK